MACSLGISRTVSFGPRWPEVVSFLFWLILLILRAGCHDCIELRILREVVYEGDCDVPEKQKALTGIGVGHIGKLVRADTELFCDDLPVALCLCKQDEEIRVLKNILDFRAGKEVVG